MTRPATMEDSIRLAVDSVSQARETLQRLRSRVHSEPDGAIAGYVEALDGATSLIDQLLELLSSPGEVSGAGS